MKQNPKLYFVFVDHDNLHFYFDERQSAAATDAHRTKKAHKIEMASR